MTYSLATPCGLSKNRVFELARQAYDSLHMLPGKDLPPVVASLGGKVQWVNTPVFDQTIDGSIVVHAPRKFDIFVASDVGPLRARFTIAHELGHYFLHSANAPNGKMIAERYGKGRAEWEANWFAAGFLMPEHAFRQLHAKHAGYLADIANEFQVSLAAAEIRAKDIGLQTW